MLWTSIDLRYGPKRVSFFLEHSKQASLEIYCSWPTESLDEDAPSAGAVSGFLKNNISRAVGLRLPVTSELNDLLVGHVSSLRRLTLTETNYDDEEELGVFLDILRGTEACMLQYLCCEGIDGSWFNDACHPCLTEFRLENCDCSESMGPLLSALRGLPALQTFYFNCFQLPEDPLPSPEMRDVITLAHLHTIQFGDTISKGLDDDGTFVFSFLNYFDLSSVTSTWIVLGNCSDGDLPLTSIRSPNKFHHASLTPAQHFDGDGVHKGWSLTLRSGGAIGTRSSTLRVDLWSTDSSSAVLLAQLAKQSIKALPLSDVTTFTAVQGEPIGLVPLVHAMSSLRTLRISKMEWMIFGFLAELCKTQTSADKPEGSLGLTLTHLETLELSQVVFPPWRHPLKASMSMPNVGVPSSESVRLKIDTIVYDACVNLNARHASLLKQLTGAASDNFVDPATERFPVCDSDCSVIDDILY